MKKKVLRILAALLIFSVCTSLLPASVLAVSAEEPMEERTPTIVDFLAGTATAEDIYGALDASIVPAIIDYDEAVERNHIARCYEEEGTDLNKIIFLNVDGSKTMYTFDFPVKYVDDNGDIQDIRLEIADSTVNAGEFETAANDTVTTFSAKFTDGITLEGNNTEIRLIPVLPLADLTMTTMSSTNIAAPTATAQRIDADTVAYPYDAKTTVEYSLTYTGFKEDIVVSEYTGQTTYPFRLLTNGLALEEISGSFFLVDDEGNIEASIGDIIIFTADERNNAFGDIEPKTIVENQEYLLNIVVDADYLADPETTYPIRIDPTIEINYSNSGGNAIEDITITTNTEYTGSHTSLYVGRRSTEGIARALMRFPGLDLTELEGATVTSASVRVRDLMCEDTPLAVSCHVFSGNIWDADSATWADVSPDSYVLTALSTNTLSWSIGETFDPVHWYYFDITDAVRGWMNGNYTQSKGIIFKVRSAVENGSTIANRTFGSYNRASYRPSLIVTYTLPDSTINIREGGTSTLSAAGTTGTVTWASSDAAVATVNTAGLVTGVKAGYTTVTASVNGVVEKTFHVYVAVADGVYYIKNNNSGYYLSVKDSAIINSSNATQESKRTASPGRFSQLWKITYLSNGRYSIRPMHRLNMGLDVSGTTVDIWNATETDSISSVPPRCQWTITYSASGYIFRQGGLTSRTMAPNELSTAVNATIAVGVPGNLNSAYIWTLEDDTSSIPDQMIFYDGKTKTLTHCPTRYVAPSDTYTLTELNISVSFVSETTNQQNVSWRHTEEEVATVAQGSGLITAILPGESTTIYADRTYNGATYSIGYMLHITEIPEGTYFIRSKDTGRYVDIDEQIMQDGTQIHQWDLHGGNSQKWIFTHRGDGTYTIKSANSTTDMYLGVDSNSSEQDANVTLRTGAIESGMTWEITKTTSGAYKLTPSSGKAVNRVLAVGWYLANTNGIDILQRGYIDDSNYKDEWNLTMMLPTSGYELEYSPELWDGNVEGMCNCYAYAINNQVYPGTNSLWFKQQPGQYYTTITSNQPALTNYAQAAENDYDMYNQCNGTSLIFRPIERYEVCPVGTYKVALVLSEGDYHWYRQDADGLWSHKQGLQPVKKVDESGLPIVDPQTADRGEYTVFVGYFAVSPWNNMYAENRKMQTIASCNPNAQTAIVISETQLEQVRLGMTLDEVLATIGFPGVDIGSGKIIYQYSLAGGEKVNVVFGLVGAEHTVVQISKEG